MADSTGLQFTLTLPGADDTAVVRFTHREALSEPFALSVEFASRTHDLSPSDCLDQNATLTIWQDGEPLRRVHGIISELHRGDRGHRRSFYRVEIRPALWRLSLRHNSRIFQDTSPYDAITTLANERGLTDIGFATTRMPLDREYLVQYRETDLAFIERLAAEEGCFYFHEFENAEGGKHQLVFADATVVLPGVGERTYHARAGGTPPRRHVRKLRQVNRVRPASTMLKDYTFKNPRYAQLHEHQGRDIEASGQRTYYEHFDYPGRYKKDASGKPFTRHRLESLRADASTAEAESDLPELAPGICFTLTDHDIDSLNCRWQVVSVVHHGEQPQALEEDGMARGNNGSSVQPGEQMTRYYNELLIMPRDQTFRPVPNPKPRVDGPQVAFVVGPEGEEIYCDEYGRVKVQFPWDRYAQPNETASCWVRVAQGWAGGGYGSMVIPRIGHEVIISHLEGDPDQPLITGRTYHASNTPPYPLPANKTRTVIRTQSHKSKGFNELRFEDATDQEQVWFHAQKDLELLTLNDRTEEVKRDSHLKIHRHRQTEIGNDDHHTVHRHRFEHTEGTQHLNVEGSMHMRAGQAWLSESGRELHIKSGQQAVLEADGEITLKVGGSFIKLDAGGITIVGPQVKINAGGSPGSGTGQAAEKPRLPGEAVPELSEDVTLMAHQQAELESEEAGFFQNAWRHTKGFGRGAAEVVEEAVEGTIDMAVYSAKVSPGSWALEQLHPTYQGHSDAINAARETTAMLIDNPGLVADAVTEPYRDAMARGEVGEAIGRGGAEFASLIFAPARIGQTGRAASRVGQLGRGNRSGVPVGNEGVQISAKQGGKIVHRFDNVTDFNRAANNPLPNARYEYDPYAWETDNLGRVTEASGTVRLDALDGRAGTDGISTSVIGKEGQPGDVGFHLIGDQFGGPTNRLNVVPGNGARVNPNGPPNLNQGQYGKFERSMKRAAQDPLNAGKNVEVRISPQYGRGNTTSRPDQFEASYRVESGEWETFIFTNQQGG